MGDHPWCWWASQLQKKVGTIFFGTTGKLGDIYPNQTSGVVETTWSMQKIAHLFGCEELAGTLWNEFSLVDWNKHARWQGDGEFLCERIKNTICAYINSLIMYMSLCRYIYICTIAPQKLYNRKPENHSSKKESPLPGLHFQVQMLVSFRGWILWFLIHMQGSKVRNQEFWVIESTFEQWKKKPGCLGYIGDYTTQLYGD